MSSGWLPAPQGRRRPDAPSGGPHRRSALRTPPFGIDLDDDEADQGPYGQSAGRRRRHAGPDDQAEGSRSGPAPGEPSYYNLAYGARGYDVPGPWSGDPVYGAPVAEAPVRDARPRQSGPGYRDPRPGLPPSGGSRPGGPGDDGPRNGRPGRTVPQGGGARYGDPADGGTRYDMRESRGPQGGGARYGDPADGGTRYDMRESRGPRNGRPGRTVPQGRGARDGDPADGGNRYDMRESRGPRHRGPQPGAPGEYGYRRGGPARNGGWQARPESGASRYGASGPQTPRPGMQAPGVAAQAPPGQAPGGPAQRGYGQPGNAAPHRGDRGYGRPGDAGPRPGAAGEPGRGAASGAADGAAQARVPRQPGPGGAPIVAPYSLAGARPQRQADRARARSHPDTTVAFPSASTSQATVAPKITAGSDTGSEPAVVAAETGTRSHRRGAAAPVRPPRPGSRRAQVTTRTRRTDRRPSRTAAPAPRPRRRLGRKRGLRLTLKTWLWTGGALAALVAVIAAAVTMLGKGSGGPTHTLATPVRLGSFTRSPQLTQQMDVGQLERNVIAQSSGQASHLVSAVYQAGAPMGGGAPAQVMLFIGGRLSGASPEASAKSFTQHFKGARVTSAGRLGGYAACVNAQAKGTGGSTVCAWFDDDTFGELVSPNMTTSALGSELRAIRPSVEHLAHTGSRPGP